MERPLQVIDASPNIVGDLALTVQGRTVYAAWRYYDYTQGVIDRRLAASADGGFSWTPVASLPDIGFSFNLAADPQTPDRLYAAYLAGGDPPGYSYEIRLLRSDDGWLYLAESVDGGRQLSQPAGVAELGYPLGELVLAADPLSGLAVALWNRNSTELRAVSTAPPPQPGDCLAVELLSARRLDEQTLGVVGWVDLNAGLQAASLTAAGVAAPVDLLALAQHNAPSGGSNPGGEQRWPGLWSATLHSGESFAGPVTLAAATVDAAGVPCVPPKQLELPAASPWRLELQTIVPAGDDPAAAGLARIAGTLSSLWGNAPALPEPLTFTLSRYVAGSPGQWVEVAAVSSPGPAWSFTDIPAGVVQPGENLYRVAATGPDGALLAEDVEGFYAVAATESLTTGTNENDRQRRQALVFRDTVREVLNSERRYAEIFPEQLILAIGSAENGMFDNAIADGIMQVTCASGHQGETERNGIVCILPPKHRPNDPPTNPYIYMDTTESIKFNVSDALLVLLEAYNTTNQQNTQFHKPNCRPISDINDPHRVDKLISSVLYYNGGVCYGKIYKQGGGNPQYLYDVVRQLDPQPDYPNSLPNNQNIAQFLADADHIAGVGLTPDLVTRLNYGQDIVNQVLE